MVTLMYLVAYVLAVIGFALVALERAQRSAHLVRGDALIGFGIAGALSTIVTSLENSLSPLLLVTFACVAVCAATDLSSGLIYNSVLACAMFGAVANAFVGDGLASIGGALVGFGLAMVLRVLTQGRGLGFGDVKLFAVVGAGLGVLAVAYCFGGAFMLGAIVSVGLVIATRMPRSETIRFAPYVAIATMVTPCLYLPTI